MIVADMHCDSIMKVAEGQSPLVGAYNFSGRYPQLQTVALFCDRDTQEESERTMEAYFDAFAHAMQTESRAIAPVTTYAEISAVLNSGRHAALLSTEGGLGYRNSPEFLRKAYARGVRIVAMAWLCNDMVRSNRVSGTGQPDTGLSELGRAFVEEGNRLGVIFDASHLSDKSFYDLLAVSKKPVIATHSNFRALCPHSRNLTDDMARQIVQGGGIIGMNLYTPLLAKAKEQQTIDAYFRHLEYGLERFGEEGIGFGGDIDGCDGQYPAPLDESASIHDRLIAEMQRRGYSQTLIEKVAGGNFLAFLARSL